MKRATAAATGLGFVLATMSALAGSATGTGPPPPPQGAAPPEFDRIAFTDDRDEL